MVCKHPILGAIGLVALSALSLGGCAVDVGDHDGRSRDEAEVVRGEVAESRAGARGRTQSATCDPATCDPLCVDEGRYLVTSNVVHDTRTSYRWQRRASEQLSHADSIEYCATLVLGGLSGWRMPTTEELSGIRYKPGGLFGGGPDAHYCIPSIDQAAFPETPADLFWTSVTGEDDLAWYVGFDDGRAHPAPADMELWVRCVHDPVLSGG